MCGSRSRSECSHNYTSLPPPALTPTDPTFISRKTGYPSCENLNKAHIHGKFATVSTSLFILSFIGLNTKPDAKKIFIMSSLRLRQPPQLDPPF